MHKHLKRLSRVWVDRPVYFITACVAQRRALLTHPDVLRIITDEFHSAPDLHGWHVGSFVLMPDHVHFFCVAEPVAQHKLSQFIGAFKEWTTKRLARELKFPVPLWQKEFLIMSCAAQRVIPRNGGTLQRIPYGLDWWFGLRPGPMPEKSNGSKSCRR